jgi:hypothetical protein
VKTIPVELSAQEITDLRLALLARLDKLAKVQRQRAKVKQTTEILQALHSLEMAYSRCIALADKLFFERKRLASDADELKAMP